MQLERIQQALREADVDGWLFFDHHLRDPLAYRVLGFEAARTPTRRWYYFIPSEGEPRGLVHGIEPGMLDELPGDKTKYSSWSQQAKLLPADGAAGHRFGNAVSLSGNTVMIGAPLDDDLGEFSGSAYVFQRDGTSWIQQAKLLADNGAPAESCLAITFTRRAAQEMRERLATLLPDDWQKIPAHTFHSLGLALLREDAEAAGPVVRQVGVERGVVERGDHFRDGFFRVGPADYGRPGFLLCRRQLGDEVFPCNGEILVTPRNGNVPRVQVGTIFADPCDAYGEAAAHGFRDPMANHVLCGLWFCPVALCLP